MEASRSYGFDLNPHWQEDKEHYDNQKINGLTFPKSIRQSAFSQKLDIEGCGPVEDKGIHCAWLVTVFDCCPSGPPIAVVMRDFIDLTSKKLALMKTNMTIFHKQQTAL